MLVSTIVYFPSVLYFCCFVLPLSFNLRQFFGYAHVYVRTGRYTPDNHQTGRMAKQQAPKWKKIGIVTTASKGPQLQISSECIKVFELVEGEK